MNKAYGGNNAPVIECINYKIGKYRIRWDYRSYGDGVSFMEEDILHKPTIQEVKDIVINGINKSIDEKILSGFEWKGMPIWLSSENQFNYKATYDLAVMKENSVMPVVFKFGTTDTPIYHEFATLEELEDFYLKAIAYIRDTLADGWKMKDSINWNEYEEALINIG